jgi:tRNA wybutosine-synthesizing protein 3
MFMAKELIIKQSKENFERRKKQQLSKSDRSDVGGIDKKIAGLCSKINKSKDYYTTSSCSGRIVIIRNPLGKKPGVFLYRSHQKVSFKEIMKEIKKIADEGVEKGVVYFKQEPAIMAIACKDLESAGKLLYIAREKVGFKNSGIMSLKKRVIAEIRATEYLALPIMNAGKLIVSEDYLCDLIKEANSRLERTWKKIKKLEKEL